MDLLNKININLNDLTKEELEQIDQIPELVAALVDSIARNGVNIDFFDKMNESLIKKIIFKEPVFLLVIDYYRQSDEEELINSIFGRDFFYEFMTPENELEALRLIARIQDEYFDVLVDKMKNDPEFSMSTNNTRIINYIVDNKLYDKAGWINLKEDEVSEKVENFLLEALVQNEDVILSTRTPKITQYCLDNKCIHRILLSFDPRNPEELQIIKDAVDNGNVTYSQLNARGFSSAIVDSPTFIIQKLLAGGCLTDEQKEYVKGNPLLLSQIVEIISTMENADDVPYSINDLGRDIPEIEIAYIKYNVGYKGYNSKSVLADYIDVFSYERYGLKNKADKLLDLLDKRHDLLIDAIKYFLNNHVDQQELIADISLLVDSLGEIREVIFDLLSPMGYSNLLFKYLDFKNIYPNTIKSEKLYTYIQKNNISLTILDIEALNKTLPFNIYITLLRNITAEQLDSGALKINNVLSSSEYTNEQKQEIISVIIDKAIAYKSGFLNSNVYLINQYGKPEDIQRLIENIADLKMDFESILDLKNTDSLKGKSYDELVETFRYAKRITGHNIERVAYFADENNIQIVRWMLQSPALEINNDFFYYLAKIDYLFADKGLLDYYVSYVKEFFIKTGNIPAKYTYKFGTETIEKATLTCGDDTYIDKTDFLLLDENSTNTLDNMNYYNVLFEKIKERVFSGKQVNYELLNLCVLELRINPESVKELLDTDMIFWDNRKSNITSISQLVNNPTYEEYIRKNVIPTLTVEILDSGSFKYPNLLKYMPEFLNRLNELINENKKFNWSILTLLILDKEGLTHHSLNQIYEKDLIDFSGLSDVFYGIQHPLIDKIIVNRIITDSTLLDFNVQRVLSKDNKYEKLVAEEVNSSNYISNRYFFKDIRKYPVYFQAILKALREGRAPIRYQINANYYKIEILQAIIDNNEENISLIIDDIIHNYQNPSKEIFEFLIPHICKFKNYNEENYKYLYSIYGNTIIPLFQNEDFQLFCNQDIEAVKRLVALLEPKTLDKKMIEGINNSIRQNIYAAKNPDIITIYTKIVTLIQTGIFDEVREKYLEVLLPAVPNGLEKKIAKTGNTELLNYYQTDKRLFLNYLFDCVWENQNIYGPILNSVTTNFITIKRNEFASQDDIFRDTNIKYTYDKKSLYDAVFKRLLETDKKALLRFLRLPSWLRFDDMETEDLGDHFIDYYTIQFLSGNDIDGQVDKEQLIQIKRNIRTIKELFYQRMEEETLDQLPDQFKYLLDDPKFESSVKRILVLPTRERNLGQEFSKLNIKTLIENVLNDKEKYDMLLQVIKKFRLLDWSDLFEPTIKQLSIAGEIDSLYSFINAFNQIYEAEKKNLVKNTLPKVMEKVAEMREEGIPEEEIEKFKEKELKVQFSAFKILKYCSIYSSIPNCYKIMLGMEDFDLVRKNEGPNASTRTVSERMPRVCEVHLKAIKQQEVSIPSFITDKTLENGKKIRAIVGNRAHPRNMTHGERTGACMRALGHADQRGERDLFEFSATNFNGFHITFLNPETGEYISRVSGFRNGNTVFLNQLRNVVKDIHDYLDIDVIEAMKLVGQEIIEASKDSDYPIENVVASATMALLGYPTQELGVYDIGQGVYTGYKDVTHNAVVLATTGKDGKAAKVELDNSRHPSYKCVRVYPEELMGNINEKDKIRFQRITALKQVLEHEDDPHYYEGIDIDVEALEEEFVYAIIGQDWYVALSASMEIKSDIILLDERAQIEFDEAMRKVTEYRESIVRKTGGLING